MDNIKMINRLNKGESDWNKIHVKLLFERNKMKITMS